MWYIVSLHLLIYGIKSVHLALKFQKCEISKRSQNEKFLILSESSIQWLNSAFYCFHLLLINENKGKIYPTPDNCIWGIILNFMPVLPNKFSDTSIILHKYCCVIEYIILGWIVKDLLCIFQISLNYWDYITSYPLIIFCHLMKLLVFGFSD